MNEQSKMAQFRECPYWSCGSCKAFGNKFCWHINCQNKEVLKRREVRRG